MPIAPGFRTLLVTGLAQHAASLDLGTWRTTGVYTAAETGIVIGAFPAAPDRLIALTGYGVTDHPHLSDDVVGVQARFRWGGQDPRPVDDLADALFDQWQALRDFTLPTGVRVIFTTRQSSVSLGQDGNSRWTRADNYYITAHRPSPNRT